MHGWRIEESMGADWFVMAPDEHGFFFGNIENIDGCCFRTAYYVVRACNYHDELIKLLENIANDPMCSTYFTQKIKPILEKIKKEIEDEKLDR